MNRVYDVTLTASIESTLDDETLKRLLVLALIDPETSFFEPPNRVNTHLDYETEMLEVIDYHSIHLVETCPNCPGKSLVFRMFDIDGTNLEEHGFCENCGHGRPALQ